MTLRPLVTSALVALALPLVGCGRDTSDAAYPGWPPGQPLPSYPTPAHNQPGYPKPGYPRPGNLQPATVGSAWTPFGELLGQLPIRLPPAAGPRGGRPRRRGPAAPAAHQHPARPRRDLRQPGAAPPVATHPQLRAAARGHASDMAQRDYFDHRPEGTGPMQRAVAAGYQGGFVEGTSRPGSAAPLRWCRPGPTAPATA